jgi:hypothetical protein
MHEWAKQLAVERPELRERFSCPIVEERLDAPRARAVFWSGKGYGKCGEIVDIAAPEGSTLVVWSLPSLWSEVQKLWQFVLAELVRRRWCEPESEASDEPAGDRPLGFVKKNSRVHNRYLETAKTYVAMHFDVERTKRWYSGRYPQFQGGKSSFERMLTYMVEYDRWVQERSQNVK